MAVLMPLLLHQEDLVVVAVTAGPTEPPLALELLDKEILGDLG
jgi:hypothetical protein